MKNIFIGKDRHLRSGWQLLIAFLGFIVSDIFFQIVLSLLIMALKIPMTEASQLLFQTIINIGSTVVSIFLFIKLNHASIRVVGYDKVQNSWKQFVIGSLTGIVSMAVLAGFSYLLGDYHIVSVNFKPILLLCLIYYISVGIVEESLCRGFMQQAVLIRMGRMAALLIPSLLFASLHLLNPDFSAIAMLNTALAGIVMGMFAIRYDNIAAAIGYHIFWNFFQGNVFGIEVSGQMDVATIIKVIRDRDTIWTGGSYGLEGGLLCTIALGITIVLQFILIKQRPENSDLQTLKQPLKKDIN